MTLNEQIEAAWMRLRESSRSLSVKDRRTFENRMFHVIAKELNTSVERVRQRVAKIEKKEKA